MKRVERNDFKYELCLNEGTIGQGKQSDQPPGLVKVVAKDLVICIS